MKSRLFVVIFSVLFFGCSKAENFYHFPMFSGDVKIPSYYVIEHIKAQEEDCFTVHFSSRGYENPVAPILTYVSCAPVYMKRKDGEYVVVEEGVIGDFIYRNYRYSGVNKFLQNKSFAVLTNERNALLIFGDRPRDVAQKIVSSYVE